MNTRMFWFACGGAASIATLSLLVEWTMSPPPIRTDPEHCPFCQKNVLERQKFFEDEHVLALVDYHPIALGHCLVIPKRHVSRFEDLTTEEGAALFATLRKVQSAVRKVYGYEDYAILQKNGQKSFQTVGHVHFHLYPGFSSSALRVAYRLFSRGWQPILAEDQLRKEADQLSLALSSNA